MTPRTLLALALGAHPAGASICAVCGESPFQSSGPVGKVLRTNFGDHDILAEPAAPDVCTGCDLCLSGRPGRVPPPLRTVSVRVDAQRPQLVVLDRAAWWRMISCQETVRPCVLSWATSRKKHHWLRAGLSTAERWVVGSDDGPIEWTPDPGMAGAILALLRVGARKGQILAGLYTPKLWSQHRTTIVDAERVLVHLRRHPILDLAVWAAPRVERDNAEESQTVIDPHDARAAEVLEAIVTRSKRRSEEGLQFWGGFLLRRLRRYGRMPLPTLTSRLLSDCQVSVDGAASAVQLVEALSADEQRSVETSIRERPDLVHALAFSRIKAARKARKETP